MFALHLVTAILLDNRSGGFALKPRFDTNALENRPNGLNMPDGSNPLFRFKNGTNF